MTRFYVTTPIYYVNDVPHIGHAYTTIAADVLARWHRLQGREVFFLTGTDEHGTKIAQAAAAHNKDPKTYCDEIAALFQDAWKCLDISQDAFIRTTSPPHERGVQAFLKQLWEKGYIFSGSYTGKYCVQCERFYADEELLDGLCPDHRTPPEVQSEENYFFRLSHFKDQLLASLAQEDHPSHFKIFPRERRNEVIGKLKQDINDISISRATLSWGIPLPWDRSQTTYVWIDALLNYLTALGHPDDAANLQRWWPVNLHLMAKDILWFHAIVWPALLMAVGIPPPKKIFAHGFFTVNGQKMSKSLGNVIRPAEMIQHYGVDGTRYLLLSAFPFGADGDFSQGTFKQTYNALLANDLGNLISRSLTMLAKYAGGRVPPGSPGTLTEQVLKDLEGIGSSLDHLAFQAALTALFTATRRMNTYIEEKAPWRLAREQNSALPHVLCELTASLRILVFYLWPFMPETAQKLWNLLGEKEELLHHGKRFFQAPSAQGPLTGQAIGEPVGLFPRK